MTGFFSFSRRKDCQFAKLPITSAETNPTFSANSSANSKDYFPSKSQAACDGNNLSGNLFGNSQHRNKNIQRVIAVR